MDDGRDAGGLDLAPNALGASNNSHDDLQLFTPGASPAIQFALPVTSPSFPLLDDDHSNHHVPDHLLKGWDHGGEDAAASFDMGRPHTHIKQECESTSSVLSTSSTIGGIGVGKGHGTQVRIPSEIELRQHFGMPLSEVATKFGISLDALKEVCMKYGVKQWPHRKLVAIEKSMASLRQELKNPTIGGRSDAAVRAEIKMNEQLRDKIFDGKFEDLEGQLFSSVDDGDCLMSGFDRHVQHVKSERFASSSSSLHKDHDNLHGHPYDGGLAGRSFDGGVQATWTEAGIAEAGVSEPGIAQPDSPGVQLLSSKSADAAKEDMTKLEEESASLRAISKYLMQERQELMRKSEKISHTASNMRALVMVLKHQLGILKDPRQMERDDAVGGGLEDGLHDEVLQQGLDVSHLHFTDQDLMHDGDTAGVANSTHHDLDMGAVAGDGGLGGNVTNHDLNWFSSAEHLGDLL